MNSYIKLTKPTIVLLFALTGLAGLVLQGQLSHDPLRFWVILVGITLTAGSANALNMYFDRDIDSQMARTRAKRPIPRNDVSPLQALTFGLILGAVATALLLWMGNGLAALLGVFTIAFYVGIYTLILKRRTPYNIVIGGAAGATAPLIGWAAATGHLSIEAWLLFAIIFAWTPPHFWALALVMKEDYARVNVPMLPVVAGEKRTRLEILVYCLLLIPLTMAPPLLHLGGTVYLFGAALLNILFVHGAWRLWKVKTNRVAYGLFGYSIVYLLILFCVLMIGHSFVK